MKQQKYFTQTLLDWYQPADRPMPWKEEKNPYLIWLSEIILQQTRVEQGLNYFLKFKQQYPSVFDLAKAPEDELMKMWEGLGYYARARNLHTAAKHIANELNGHFPTSYEDIIQLKGVGSYTAAAIASFAYNLPYAVVDGNVNRVLTRFFGIQEPVDTRAGKKIITELAQKLLSPKVAGIYNQAIMDFGATVCKPKKPLCPTCPFSPECIALQKQLVDRLPIKAKRIKIKKRYFNYLVIHKGSEIFLKKRTKKDIWQNLYEFPVIETLTHTKENDTENNLKFYSIFFNQFYGISSISVSYIQKLTHLRVFARFYEINVNDDFLVTEKDWLAINKVEIRRYAFPKIIDSYLSTWTNTM